MSSMLGPRAAGPGPERCLLIWKQYCSNVRRPEYGTLSESTNSAARNMDLMDNLTSSQKNPDSSPGLHLALGFSWSSAQPQAMATVSRNRLTWDWSVIFFFHCGGVGGNKDLPGSKRTSVLETPQPASRKVKSEKVGNKGDCIIN